MPVRAHLSESSKKPLQCYVVDLSEMRDIAFHDYAKNRRLNGASNAVLRAAKPFEPHNYKEAVFTGTDEDGPCGPINI